MAAPNFKNRTLWTGDNLHVMRGLNSETVDLIYLGPAVQLQPRLRCAYRLGGGGRGLQGHLDALRRRPCVAWGGRRGQPRPLPRH